MAPVQVVLPVCGATAGGCPGEVTVVGWDEGVEGGLLG